MQVLTTALLAPLNLKSGGKIDGFCVQLRGVAFGYPGSDAPLFRNAELSVDTKSRIVLLGENGNGKSTLPHSDECLPH